MSRSRGRKPVSLALSGRPRAKPRSVGPPTPRRSCRPAGSWVCQVHGLILVAPEAEVCQGCDERRGDLQSWRSGASGHRSSDTRARPPRRPSGGGRPSASAAAALRSRVGRRAARTLPPIRDRPPSARRRPSREGPSRAWLPDPAWPPTLSTPRPPGRRSMRRRPASRLPPRVRTRPPRPATWRGPPRPRGRGRR